MNRRYFLILIFLTLIIFILLPFAPFIRDWLSSLLKERNYKILWICLSVLFFLPVFYFSFKKPVRFLLIAFLIVLFLIKGAPEEKFHLFIYFLMGYFSKRTFKNYGIIYVTGIALIDEIIQYFLPNRYFDFKDIVLNTGGGIAGFLF